MYYISQLGEIGDKEHWKKWAEEFYIELNLPFPFNWWEKVYKNLHLTEYVDKYNTPLKP